MAPQTNERHLAELAALNAINQIAAAQSSAASLYQTIHAEIQRLMGEVDFIVARYNPARRQIEIPYACENGQSVQIDPFPFGEGLTSLLIETRQPLLLAENAFERALALGAKLSGAPPLSWLGVPLLVAGEVVGALIVQDTRQANRFDEEAQRLLILLAGGSAIAMRNLQLLEDTRRQIERQRILSNVLGKVWATTDIETILRITLQELGHALRVSEGWIRLGTSTRNSSSDPSHE